MKYINLFEKWDQEYDIKKYQFGDDIDEFGKVIRHIIKTEFGNGVNLIGKDIGTRELSDVLAQYSNYMGFDKTVNYLKKYFKAVNNIYKNGGLLYRILLIDDIKNIEHDHYGDYWTVFSDKEHIDALYTTLSADWENENEGDYEKAFLLTVKTVSGNINMGMVNLKDYLTEAEVAINDPKSVTLVDIKEIKD